MTTILEELRKERKNRKESPKPEILEPIQTEFKMLCGVCDRRDPKNKKLHTVKSMCFVANGFDVVCNDCGQREIYYARGTFQVGE